MQNRFVWGAVLLLVACGDPSMGGDGGLEDAGSETCASNADCDDGRFCNGVESCAPGDPLAGANGCVAAESPCAEECDESLARCLASCDGPSGGDADGDGHVAMACGGDDCDDTDMRVSPSRPEVCDEEDRDEDCDPTTFGERDADGDGYIDLVCCNGEVCGDDCDDASRGSNPGQVEVCDRFDNDCDGVIDERVERTFYVDVDGDGFGSPTDTIEACAAPLGYAVLDTDCDDTRGDISPSAAERCDGVADDDCDGAVDEGCECAPEGASRACGPDDEVGECRFGTQSCVAGTWTACTGAVSPAGEVCEGSRDEDCDGTVDEVGAVECWADPDDDGWAASGAENDAYCPVAGREPEGGCPVGFTQREPAGVGTTDCADSDETRFPTAVEVCNGIDEDCDGIEDDGADADCAADDAFAVCHAGACGLVGCEVDRADCDGVAANGCETDLTVSVEHCGGCDRPCPFGRACTGGICSPASVVEVGAGEFGCARFSDGLVACWGVNSHGERGDGVPGTRNRAIDAVVGLTDATAISVGLEHACAVRETGSVVCWGGGGRGRLGNNDDSDQMTPVPVSGLTGVTDVGAGDEHSCALLSNGQVWCWGRGTYLGASAGFDAHVPMQVTGITDAVELAVGPHHSCARHMTGAVSCWGRNGTGQLGDGTTDFANVPVSVTGLTDAVELSVDRVGTSSSGHSCARRATGHVVCWGFNLSGQLGDGTNTQSPTPVTVSGITDAIGLGTGRAMSCAIRSDETLWCWGSNTFGQVGDGLTDDTNTPRQVLGLTNVSQVEGGQFFTCALANDRVVCWGYNTNSELGDRSSVLWRHEPITVAGLVRVTDHSGGRGHACVSLDTGRAWCWGANAGLLGDGTSADRTLPDFVSGLTGVVEMGAAAGFNCARTVAGRVHCWGGNSFGQLGDGTMDSRDVPVEVVGLTDVVDLGVGTRESGSPSACAVRRDGSVWCWGANEDGQLGRGTTSPEEPTAAATVALPAPVIQVTSGSRFACALLNTGQVTCWGSNDDGELGRGGVSDAEPTPQVVAGLPPVRAIDAGSSHVCALTVAGELYCWGWNEYGSVGDGSFDVRASPVMARVPDPVERFVAELGHTCATTTRNEMYCWGFDGYNQLGEGPGFDPVSLPTLIATGLDPDFPSSGQTFVCSRDVDGALWCAGASFAGAIGFDAVAPVDTPILVPGI